MSVIPLPNAVEQFVVANNAHDTDALLAVFTDDAVVRDDGKTIASEPEIRAWIRSHLIDPNVVITPLSFSDGRLLATSAADLPGSPWTFAFDFTMKDGRISGLSIELA
jgi:hypothetical protein